MLPAGVGVKVSEVGPCAGEVVVAGAVVCDRDIVVIVSVDVGVCVDVVVIVSVDVVGAVVGAVPIPTESDTGDKRPVEGSSICNPRKEGT